jgi:hypothetical protein
MINSIVFLIINNILNFSMHPRIKATNFILHFLMYPSTNHTLFSIQHNNPGQTYPLGLSVTIFCVSHVDRQEAQISHA